MSEASPFSYRDYRAFWVARLLSTIASTMLVVVIGIHVYDIARQTMSIERSSFWLGMVGLAQFLPLFLLALIAGYVADRIDRRNRVVTHPRHPPRRCPPGPNAPVSSSQDE